MSRRSTALLFAATLAGCASCGGRKRDSGPSLSATIAEAIESAPTSSAVAIPPPKRPPHPVGPDFDEDILSTDLDLDLASLSGRARITFDPSPSGLASFESGDLHVSSVTSGDTELVYAVSDHRLDVELPDPAPSPFTIEVSYTFQDHAHSDGFDRARGYTFLFPHFCGNLFPCKSDPSDGLTFRLSVEDASAKDYVFPSRIAANAPYYMIALARGPFKKLELGTTKAGTKVSVWYKPNEERLARFGTQHLVSVFDFYETTYGPYSFGNDVGSVSVNWGSSPYGGMEHHPYWHIEHREMGDEYTHAHEAAHGWFGDGVRMACLEDFVFSEGTTTYISARALAKVSGPNVWKEFACELKADCESGRNTIVRPPTCNVIDWFHSALAESDVPYMKGVFFYKAVADILGADDLDKALGEFYRAHVGNAVHMRDMVDFLETKTSVNSRGKIAKLATEWLESLACPVDLSKLCVRG